MTETPPYEKDICALYDRIAGWFDGARDTSLFEKTVLDTVAARLPEGGAVLDLGCGTGEPVARYFIERGFAVTGIDGAPAMIDFCKQRFPAHEWLTKDMRGLAVGRKFHAVIAWNSLFHLTREEQRAMFPVFAAHCMPGSPLLFSCGPDDGERIAPMRGKEEIMLYHASLSPQEYRRSLKENGFDVLCIKKEDPGCRGHSYVIAVKNADT